MRSFHHICFLAAITFIGLPAQAEQASPFKGGMSYTVIGNKSAPAKEDKKDSVRYKDVTPPSEEEKAAAAEALEAENTEEPANRIWNKYKALAAGEAEEEGDEKTADAEKDSEDAETKDVKAAPEKTQQQAQAAPVKPTGFGALIDRYEQNKARQGQLRSIEIAPQPEPEKKTLETAAAEEKDPKAKPDKEDKAEAKDETEEKLEEKPVKEPKEKAKN